MKAGADSAITQYFYNTDAYFAFVDDARATGYTETMLGRRRYLPEPAEREALDAAS